MRGVSSSTPWIDRLPGKEQAVHGVPECDDAEDVALHDLRLTDASVTCAEVLERPELVDVAVDGCDVAGLVGRRGRAERLLVANSRLRGVSWIAGTVQDAVFEGVTGAEVSLRFSTLRRVAFRDCVIDGLDLAEVTFDGVRFERCVFRGAALHRATVVGLRIEGCDLTGCSGAEALRGASVHPDDVLHLGPSLAAALGLAVED